MYPARNSVRARSSQPGGASAPRSRTTAEAAYANERSMPATSRSGERFRRRSGSDRAGSPSKSRITQSFEGARSVWPRWKSPWCADDPAAGAGMRHLAEPLPDFLATLSDRLERLQAVGEVDEGSIDLLVDRRGEQPERLQAGLLGGEGRIRRVPGEAGVHGAGHLTEPTQAAEEAFRRLDQLVQRQLPPVEPVGHERLEDAERRLRGPAVVRVPAVQRRHVLEIVLAEEAEHLQLGVDPASRRR